MSNADSYAAEAAEDTLSSFSSAFQTGVSKPIPNTPWSAQLLDLDPDYSNELDGHLTNAVQHAPLAIRPALHASQAHASDTRWALSSPRFRPQPFEGSQALRSPSPSLHSLSDGTHLSIHQASNP